MWYPGKKIMVRYRVVFDFFFFFVCWIVTWNIWKTQAFKSYYSIEIGHIHLYFKGLFTLTKMVQIYTSPASQFILSLAEEFFSKCRQSESLVYLKNK